MRNSRKKSSGYTLIEILVGLTIVGLIFTYGFVSFREFSRRQSLAGTARKLRGELRLAQELAFAGRKPSDPACNSPNRLTGYNFTVPSSTSYEIYAVCSGGNVLLKKVDLPGDVTISSTTSPVLFKVLGQGTNLSSDVTVTLTQVSTGSTTEVFISPTGEMR